MNCIYTAFYNNLKSYDGNDVNREQKLEMLDICINSFRRMNPGIPVIVDRIEEEIANTADMYFDKMNRIKELNYNYNVLWVDGDTICLENIEELFTNTMSGAFWGHWDTINVVNGGVIYYPNRYLYDNYDKFVKSWIGLLSSINERGDKFIGPYEQMPITDLLLSPVNGTHLTYDIGLNQRELTRKGILFDRIYNINPFNKHYENLGVLNECNTICGKKILHLNSSDGNDTKLVFSRYVSQNLLGYTHHPAVLLERCEELGVTNRFLTIEKSRTAINIMNTTNAFICVYQLDVPTRLIRNSIFYNLTPGHMHVNNNLDNVHEYVIKNVLSGEVQIIKHK